MWVAHGLLSEENPFVAYFCEEIRANQLIARLFIVAKRVIVVAKCWLHALYCQMRMYRLSPDLCVALATLSAEDPTTSESLWTRRNVQEVRALANAHNHLDWGRLCIRESADSDLRSCCLGAVTRRMPPATGRPEVVLFGVLGLYSKRPRLLRRRV